MGTGIAAVIPIVLKPERSRWEMKIDHRDFSPTFFEYYDVNEEYWKFYFGSYKAILEEYSTLTHFERLLAIAMKNPLAGAVKLGIFG